jgi:hypothetical protein
LFLGFNVGSTHNNVLLAFPWHPVLHRVTQAQGLGQASLVSSMGPCLSKAGAGGAAHSGGSIRSGKSHHSTTVRKLADFGTEGIYEPIMMLGEGGSGVTYLCEDIAARKRVAVKFITRPIAKVVLPLVVQEFQVTLHCTMAAEVQVAAGCGAWGLLRQTALPHPSVLTV